MGPPVVNTGRAAASALVIAATPAAILPFLDWYSVTTARGELRATGVRGSPELWVVALLGAVTVAVAVYRAADPRPFGRIAAIGILLTGCVMLGWSLEAVLDVPVRLVVVDEGRPRVLAPEVGVRWPGIVAALCSAGISCVAITLMWPRRRRP